MPKKRFNLKKLNPFNKDSADASANEQVSDTPISISDTNSAEPEEVIQSPQLPVDSFVKVDKKTIRGTSVEKTVDSAKENYSSDVDISEYVDYVPFKIKVVNKDYSYVYTLGNFIKEHSAYDGSQKNTMASDGKGSHKKYSTNKRVKNIAEKKQTTIKSGANQEKDLSANAVTQARQSVKKTVKPANEVTFHFPFEKKETKQHVYQSYTTIKHPKIDVDKLDNFVIPKDFKFTPLYKEEIIVEPYTMRVNQSEKEWMVWYLFFCVFIISWAKLVYDRHFTATFSSIINGQTANRLFREKNAFSARVSLALNVASFFVLGLFVFQILHYYGVRPLGATGFFAVFLLSVLIILLYIGKSFLFLALGFISDKIKLSSEYIHNVFIYNKVLGIILLPVTVLIPFFKKDFLDEKTLIVIGIIAVSLFYLARILRGVLLCLRSNVSIFYLFLYLCVLELAPLLVLYKSIAVAS